VSQKNEEIKQQLVEFWQCRVKKCNFHVSAFCQAVQKHKLKASFDIGNILAKKYQNPFICVKVIASQMWDIF